MVQRKYSYADITGIVDGKHVYIILGNTKIAVVHSMEGGDRFIRTVRERYAEINKDRKSVV